MANDIQKSISANNIKNGTAIVSCLASGQISTLNTYVNNKPTITDIQSKFDARFDDPSYYHGYNP
jgi:hypothetical protein